MSDTPLEGACSSESRIDERLVACGATVDDVDPPAGAVEPLVPVVLDAGLLLHAANASAAASPQAIDPAVRLSRA
ncbi:MAG TPA: hypothetical protein VKU92_10580 [Acidimicrobiales bacterium]|nr:hypothetical protein [Acidimicrobiales bacterium]